MDIGNSIGWVDSHLPAHIIAIRLAIAAILGALIGFEREVNTAEAGLRTHILVSVAAALFTILAFEIFHTIQGASQTNPDPIRAVEAVTAGIAFLGAGAIFRSGAGVQGLTTGAGMWLAGLNLPASGFAGLLPYVAPTVIGISVLVRLLMPAAAGASAVAKPDAATGLLARLPPELGRDIIAVQAQDHYVNVSTTNGSGLVLMRMSDATDALRHLAGMQIHRSWWVNLGHVCDLEKTGSGSAILVLRNGLRVPVPKSRLSEVRRAIAARGPGA